MRDGWTAADIPRQDGHRFLVTGANSGLGFAAAHLLAERGGRLLLACRRPDAAAQAAARLRALVPGAEIETRILDLADLGSVASFGSAVGEGPPLDCLINNAGIMSVPASRTVDGLERQLAVNHLGHFALTARVLPALLAAEAPRVVTVTSALWRMARLDPDHLDDRRYRAWAAYARSKLANLLFALELDRRARAAGISLLSAAAHPGYAGTGLQASPERHLGGFMSRFWGWANSHIGAAPARAVLPILRAATDPAAAGGDYYGPSRLLRGSAVRAGIPERLRHSGDPARLWEASERLTGCRFPF